MPSRGCYSRASSYWESEGVIININPVRVLTIINCLQLILYIDYPMNVRICIYYSSIAKFVHVNFLLISNLNFSFYFQVSPPFCFSCETSHHVVCEWR